MHHIQLAGLWQCKQRTATLSLVDDVTNNTGWFAASVHQALLATNQIPDPFYGRNKTLVQ